MLIGKQVTRLVQKINRLQKVYGAYLVDSEIAQDVYFNGDSGLCLATEGLLWGKDFYCGNFSFVAKGLMDGVKYYLYTETGGIEHQIRINGFPVALTDYIEHAMDEMTRTHKFAPIFQIKNGDTVSVDAYYSHAIPGTAPYSKQCTFALTGYYPIRPYRTIAIVTLYEELKDFLNCLEMLNSRYQAYSGTFEAAAVEKLYQKLFDILSLRDARPESESLTHATNLIKEFLSESHLPYVGIVGHSHLDTVWLWTIEETHRKIVRTLSNAVSLLKKYPEYKFFLSTVLYLDWLKSDEPELYKEVKEFVLQGRIEPNGATWVECDGNLTGGEAFCRQFLFGKRFLKSEYGYDSDTFWLPDTFGYTSALPQIMKECGVKYFLTTKLSLNDTNEFPFDSFIWQGLDGTKVPVHFNTINTWVDESSLKKRIDEIKTKACDCALISYGFGDGGGGPSEEMVQCAIATEKYCKFANVRHTTVSDFMKRLAAQDLPTYYGELYLELHRGTFTTNYTLKKNNRRLEEGLHNAELLAVFCGEDLKSVTDELYKTLLLNQFHDILPGTCIAEAATEAEKQQTKALKTLDNIIGGKGAKKYFNTLNFERVEVLPSKTGQVYTDFDGNKRCVAITAFKPFSFGKRKTYQEEITFDGHTVTTPFLTAKLNGGLITSVIYHGKEYVKEGFNIINFYEDIPLLHDNWDIDADYRLKCSKAQFVSSEVVADGEAVFVIRNVYKFLNSNLTTDIVFVKHAPLITFENKLEFNDDHTLLKAEFDTEIFASHYKTETQFGYVERSCRPSSVEDYAKFEVCSHKWTDLSEQNFGMTLLSDCKYGVSCFDSRLGLTLHKSGTHPDARADKGVSYFNYGILFHDGCNINESVKAGYAFNNRPVKTAKRPVPPFIVSGDENIMLETVKQGENGGIALRFYESSGGSGSITVSTREKSEFIETDILEEAVKNSVEGSEIKLDFKPFKIKTLLIK